MKLLNYYGDDLYASNKLKSITGWIEPQSGTNESGFSALPGGCRYNPFFNFPHYGFWWSSTEIKDEKSKAHCFSINEGNIAGAIIAPFDKAGGLSVRCIRD